MWSEQKLLRKKKEIGEMKEEISQGKGELNALKKRLQEEFGCSTLEEATKKISKLKGEGERIGVEIETLSTEIQETYFNEED